MTTSGVYSFEPDTSDVITSAYKLLQSVGQGETLSGNQFNSGLEQLNLLLKFWEAQGIHLWTMEEYALFFEVGEAEYDLRLPATRIVNSFESSTLAADAAVSATSITLADDSDFAVGNAIGILNDANGIQWTVINRLPGGNVVELRDALTAVSSSGRIVRTYPTANLVSTTLSAAAAITDTTIELTSVAGIVAGRVIGITDDANAVLWTTVNAVDVDTRIVTLNDAITAVSSIGNVVLAYSSEQNFIPISRVPETDSVRRNAGELSDYEIPIVFQSREEYFNLPNKRQTGTPIQAYYSRQEPQGIWYLWNAPNSAVEYLAFTAERQIQIQEIATDTFDLPAEWHLALSYNLAKLLIPIEGCSPQRVQLIREDAADYLDQALAFDSAIYPIRLKPEKYG